jgi:hypothetical protein
LRKQQQRHLQRLITGGVATPVPRTSNWPRVGLPIG